MFRVCHRTIIAAWLLFCVTAGASWYEPAWTNHRFAESNLYATNLWAVLTNRVTSGAGYTNSFTYPTVIASWSNTAGMVQTQMLLQAADQRSYDVCMAIEERHKVLTWCEQTQVFTYYRDDYTNFHKAWTWVKNNCTNFADFRQDITAVLSSNVYAIPALSTTSLIELADLPSDFFFESVKTNWWRAGYTNRYGWHPLRRAITNLQWVITSQVAEAIGRRTLDRSTPNVDVYLWDSPSSGEYEGDWVARVCTDLTGSITNMLSAQISTATVFCARSAYQLRFDQDRKRGFWGGEITDNTCTESQEMYGVSIEERPSDYAHEEGAWAAVSIHPDVDFTSIDVYGLLPTIKSNDVEEFTGCLSGIDEFLAPRPAYILYETLTDLNTEPEAVTTVAQYCAWACLDAETSSVDYAWTTTPFYPWNGFWTTVTYNVEAEGCAACTSPEDAKPELAGYQTEIQQEQEDQFGCTWWYNSEYDRFSEFEFSATLTTAGLGEVPFPQFIAVIKYDFEYQ